MQGYIFLYRDEMYEISRVSGRIKKVITEHNKLEHNEGKKCGKSRSENFYRKQGLHYLPIYPMNQCKDYQITLHGTCIKRPKKRF